MNAAHWQQLLQSPWLERVGWTLLHFLWQGALVAAVLAIALAELHRHPARTRYVACMLAAALAGVLPVLTFFLLPMPMANRGRVASVRLERAPAQRPSLSPVPAAPLRADQPPGLATARQQRMATTQPAVSDPGTLIIRVHRIYRIFVVEAKPLLPWCAAVWVLGVALLSLRLIAGWTSARRLCRIGTRPADDVWRERLEILSRRLRIRQTVRLLESALVEVPAVIGCLRPVILLPASALTGLSTEQVEMILAHELAHIGRQDYLLNLGLALFETLGFYHPAVWWLAARARQERECACDDLAVAACGGDRVGYVRALATLEEMRGPVAGVALAASGGRSLLLTRVRRLLGIAPEQGLRSGRGTWWLAGAIALSVTTLLVLGGIPRPARAQEPAKKSAPAQTAPQGSVVDESGNPRRLLSRPSHVAVLQGCVVDENGKPVAGALVYDEAAATASTDNSSLKEPTVSGADGGFQVPKLKYDDAWRVLGARLGDQALGWLDIGASATAGAVLGNRITKPLVLHTRRYPVSGVCVDDQGAPLAGVQVAITSLPAEGGGQITYTRGRPELTITQFWETLVTQTDAGGRFTLASPVERGSSLEISSAGRQTVYPFHEVTPDTKETGDLGRFTLTSAGAIAGRLAFAPDSGNKGSLAHAFLEAVEAGDILKPGPLGPKTYYNAGSPSDAAGNFRIEHLPAGSYTVYLLMFEGAPSDRPTMVLAAENVAVRTGETTSLELRAVPGWRLTVKAFDAGTGKPAGGRPEVFIEGPGHPHAATLTPRTALTEEGEWWFDVAPGHYRVWVTNSRVPGGAELAGAEVDVPADHAPEPVRLSIGEEKTLHLRGRVQDAQGKPLPLTGLVRVFLFETDPKQEYPLGGSQSSDGTFDIVYQHPGARARLVVDLPGYKVSLSPEFVLANPSEPLAVTLEEAPSVTVRGRVSGTDGQPLPHSDVGANMIVGNNLKYQVRLGTGLPGEELYTDKDGWYETRRFRLGDSFRLFAYNQAANVYGYAEPARIDHDGTTEIHLRADTLQPLPAADDAPISPRDLAGHILDAQGKPLAGAIVAVDTYPKIAPVTTNPAGGFRFADFGDRHYVTLSVAKWGFGKRWLADLTVGQDFTVMLEDKTRLRGQFLRPDGTPAGHANIVLFEDKSTRRPNMSVSGLRLDRETDEHGTYDFPVEPGSYRIEITADDHLVAQHEKFEVPEGVATALPAALQQGLRLRIQTVDSETGQPAPGAKFCVREMKTNSSIGAQPGSERETDAQGFAQWDDLLPGRVVLDMFTDETYARFWSNDERDTSCRNAPKTPHPIGGVADSRSLFINLRPERADEPVIIRTERGAIISGRVLDVHDQPVKGAYVRVAGTDPGDGSPESAHPFGLTYQTMTGKDGTFHGCIPAGNGALLRLVAENDESDTMGNGHTEPFASRPGDRHEATIHLTAGGWIEGTVVDAHDKPLPKMQVAASVLDHLDTYGNHIGFKTDDQGHFRVGPLRPAEYEVRPRGADFDWNHDEPPEEKRRVAVRSGETAQAGALHFDPAGWRPPVPPSPSPAASPALTNAEEKGYQITGSARLAAPVTSPRDVTVHAVATGPHADEASSSKTLLALVGDELQFTILGLAAGWHGAVVIDAPGCLVWESSEFTVGKDYIAIHAELQPAASAPVRGQVLGEKGEPLANVRVDATVISPRGLHYSLQLGQSNRSEPLADAELLWGMRTPSVRPELVTDAAGHFETRRLRAGDTFILAAIVNADGSTWSDSAGQPGRKSWLENRTEPLTIADGKGIEIPPLTLKPKKVLFQTRHLGSPEDPFTADDKSRLLASLKDIDDLDNQSAVAVMKVLSLVTLQVPLEKFDEGAVARFLDSGDPDVLAQAVRVLRDTKDPAVAKKVSALVPRLAARPAEAIELAVRLHRAGDDGGFDALEAILRGPKTILRVRRTLAFRLLPFAPRRFAPLYVELLSDPDADLRANALGRLRAFSGKDDFGFRPEQPVFGQAEALGRWRAWLEKAGPALPPEPALPESGTPGEPSTGWLGLVLGGEPEGAGVGVRSIVPKGPAASTGVAPDDVIIAVDGRSIVGKSLSEAISENLAGDAGVPARLTLKRAGVPEPLEITVTRAARPVMFQLPGDVAAQTPVPVMIEKSDAEILMNASAPGTGGTPPSKVGSPTPVPPAPSTSSSPSPVPAATPTPTPVPSPVPSPAATPPAAAARTLTFRVVERATAKPVPDADLRVCFDSPEGTPARADAGGVCIIPLPDTLGGSLSIRAKKPGFVPMRVDWHLDQPSFHLPLEYTVSMEPGTTISGKVVNESDQPVPNAVVLLILRGSNMGGAVEEVFADIWEERVTTDADGKWTYGAAPSILKYPSITVEHPDYARQDNTVPGPRPTVEELRAGTAVTRLRRGVRVTGVVAAENGKGIPGAVILPGADRKGSNSKPRYVADADGTFVIPQAEKRPLALTVQADGYAPEILDTPVTEGMAPLRITLPAAKVLRVRLVDASDHAVAGVLMVPDTWRGRRSLEVCLQSDDNGRIEWKSAPADEVGFSILKQGYQAGRSVMLSATADEQTLTLRRPLLVSGSVTDARTGQPVPSFRLFTGYVRPKGQRYWARPYPRPGRDGSFVEAFDEPAPLGGKHLVRVEAEGYRSAVSRPLDDAEGQTEQNFALLPGGPTAFRVFTPEGKPAAKAAAQVVFFGQPASVKDGELRSDSDQVQAAMDNEGRGTFPTQEAPYLLVVTHPEGWARVTAEDLASNPEVHLAAWGRVEATGPRTEASALKKQLYLHEQGRAEEPPAGQPLVYFDCTPAVGPDGKGVVFEKVAPGRWSLGRYGQAQNYDVLLEVRSGETAHVELAKGRSITGRLNTAAIQAPLDLTECRVQVQLKQPPPPVPAGLADDERSGWHKQRAATDEGKRYSAASRTYSGDVDEDGVFTCDGVPPGLEYRLMVFLPKISENGKRTAVAFYFTREFILPDGDDPYDFGESVVIVP